MSDIVEMPLSDDEKCAARAILSYLTPDEIGALSDTVCLRLVAPDSLQDAVDVILEFSTDLQQLLRRQKMKREHLLKFAIQQNLPEITVTDEKRTLVARILGSLGVEGEADHVQASVNPAPATGADAIGTTDSDKQQSVNLATDPIQQMAQEFARWYYTMKNDCMKIRLTDGGSSAVFGKQHFCDNSSLNLQIVDGDQRHVESIRGAEPVADKLKHFVVGDQVLFSPNVSAEGCSGRQEPHGLVLLQVQGTLHKNNNLVGVFEQSFGLVKEVMGDQWKVQVTYLKMMTGSRHQPVQGSSALPSLT